MLFKQHIKFGYIFVLLILVICFVMFRFFKKDLPEISLLNLIIAIPLIYIYSTLADCDHHLAKIRNRMFKVMFIVLLIAIPIYYFAGIYYLLGYVTIIAIIGILIMWTKHRGFIHTIWAGLFFSLPLFYFHWFYSLVAFLSYVSHLIADKLPSKRRKEIHGDVTKVYNIYK